MTAWDKREDESAKAYTAFCDYRDMGTGRSLRVLVDGYVQRKSEACPTQKWNTISTWSHKNEWQKRVKAWDEYLSSAQTQSREEAIQELLEGELSDSKMQLDKWHDAYKRMPLHEKQHTTIDEDGSVVKFIKLNYDDLARMAKWREDIGKQYRRALGLPEKVTEKHMTVETWEDKTIEYIKTGEIGYKELAEEFDDDLATKLFRYAGVEVTESSVSD